MDLKRNWITSLRAGSLWTNRLGDLALGWGQLAFKYQKEGNEEIFQFISILGHLLGSWEKENVD